MHLVSFFCKPQALIPSVASTAAVSCGSRRQGSCPDGSRRCPEGDKPDHRWQQFVNDAGKFLDQSAREAERLGWRAGELFGLHPDAPMARYDRMGLLWILKDEQVVSLTATGARLSGGLTFHRKG